VTTLIPRRTYLHLANTEVQVFTSLARRDTLPRFLSAKTPVEEPAEIPNGYLVFDSVLLALSNDLFERSGLDRGTIKTMLEASAMPIIGGIKRIEAGEDIWLTVFGVEGANKRPLEVFVGTMAEALAMAQNPVWASINGPPDSYFRVVAMTMISVAKVFAMILQKGAEIQLQFNNKLLDVTQLGDKA
jgi:hypothetical protein